jgi:hypothetical protein
MSVKPYNSKQLTLHLREIAAEAETMLDDGRVITKGEALAILLWRKALGYAEIDKKTNEEVVHRPEAWAINLIFDRVEGKVPLSMPDERQGLTASDRISDLARTKLNSAAHAAVTVPEQPADLDRSSDGSSDSEESGGEPGVEGDDTSGS